MIAAVGHAPKLFSGIDVVDDTWGGLYRGGSYLVYGSTAGGRGLLPILFASGTDSRERCLYLSSGDPQRIYERARAMGVDLGAARSVELEALHVPQASQETSDERLTAALADVVARIETDRPDRLVFDDFMPFVGFHSFGRFRESFVDMLRRVDAADATLMLVMAEPANEASAAVIEFMHCQMTAALHVQPSESGAAERRRIAFLPNIGHTGAEVVLEWDVRKWTQPIRPADRGGTSERRFRFSEIEREGPSPRSGLWNDGEASSTSRPADSAPRPAAATSRPADSPSAAGSVPSFRLGTSTAAGSDRGQPSTSRSLGAGPSRRVPAIPLGKAAATRSALVSAYRRPASAELPAFQPVADVKIEVERSSRTDREAFRFRLQQQFLRGEVNETPFLLIAMRMERRADRQARPYDFEFVLDVVTEFLREEDDLYVDLDRERLIVVLAESRPEASQPFFSRLKQRLHEEAPGQADDLLQSVSAIVVPNGRPFRNAEEFLTYALDEE